MSYSVIIPTHNRPDLVVRAIRSVHAQTSPPSEIIVIDDASTPPFVLPDDLIDKKTCIIRHERSVGGARARNSGIEAASSPVIAFLDDDDEWLPEKMEIQLSWLDDHPEADLVSCGHLRCEAGHQYLEVFTQDFVNQFNKYDNYFGSFSYIVVRRKANGVLLDPCLPALQDWDFALRATRGRSFGIIEQALVKYHAHDLPRITNRPGNHLMGLRRCFLKHREHLSADARRWIMGRIVFERSLRIASRSMRRQRVFLSIALAAQCSVPGLTKLRVIARRIACLCVTPATVVIVRSFLIAMSQSLRILILFLVVFQCLRPKMQPVNIWR